MLPRSRELHNLILYSDNWLDQIIEFEIVIVGSYTVIFSKLLESEFNIANAPYIGKALAKLCDDNSFDFLVIDMSNVIYIDSSGVGSLLSIATKIGQEKMYFHNIQESAKKVLRLMNVVGFFGIYPCKNDIAEHINAKS